MIKSLLVMSRLLLFYKGICGMINKNIRRRFMIIYRPHRGGLAEAMAEAREAEQEEQDEAR